MNRTLVLLVALATLTAGCIGGGDGQTEEDLGPTQAPGDETDSSSEDNGTRTNETSGNRSNETADPDGNETAHEEDSEPGTTWSTENRTGTVSGTNLLVTSSATAEETFTVEDGALQLTLNLTTEGGELEMCLQAPDNGTTEEEAECTETVTTEEGNATFSTAAPTSGGWTVELRATSLGNHNVDYNLEIAQQIEAGP